MISADFKTVKYSSVLREKNTLADELANQAMDDEFPIYVSELKDIQSSFFE